MTYDVWRTMLPNCYLTCNFLLSNVHNWYQLLIARKNCKGNTCLAKKATASVSPPSQAFTTCKPFFVAAQKGAICALRYIESLATEKWAGVTRHRRQGITRGNILLEWWAMLLCYFRSLRVCTFCLDLAPILNLINEDNGTFHGSIDLIACTDGKNIIGSPISRRRAQLELSVLLSKGTKMYQG